MTAPAYSSRVAPTGVKIDDGFSTTFSFASDTDVGLWEKTVKPMGFDGGDAIPTSTMHNTAWRTKAARQLKELTPMSGTCAYSPDQLTAILALINVEQAITVHFSDGDAMSAYGFLKSFEPQECAEGAQPEAQYSIEFTNVDPSTGGEEGPAFHNNPGT